MLTGEIRNKVDKIWTDIWAGGITNPLTVIEQLTYLMFIRSLDEKELENESMEALTGEPMPKIFPQDEDGQALRWSRFKTKDARLIYDIVGTKVFPFIKEMNVTTIRPSQPLYAGCHVPDPYPPGQNPLPDL